jgi:hypothetical protein
MGSPSRSARKSPISWIFESTRLTARRRCWRRIRCLSQGGQLTTCRDSHFPARGGTVITRRVLQKMLSTGHRIKAQGVGTSLNHSDSMETRGHKANRHYKIQGLHDGTASAPPALPCGSATLSFSLHFKVLDELPLVVAGLAHQPARTRSRKRPNVCRSTPSVYRQQTYTRSNSCYLKSSINVQSTSRGNFG